MSLVLVVLAAVIGYVLGKAVARGEIAEALGYIDGEWIEGQRESAPNQ